MNKITSTFDLENNQETYQAIYKGLKEYNESFVGPYERKPFMLYATNDEGKISGGLQGELLENICMLQKLWVDAEERKKGLGSALLHELEVFAKKQDCEFVQLDTAEFQAKEFYEKCGYQVIATLPKNFKNYTTYIMRKFL